MSEHDSASEHDSVPLSGKEGGGSKSLESAGRELVHDVATPLATLQLNLQVLASYLPKLMQLGDEPLGAGLEIGADRLKALAALPSALEDDVRAIRHAVQSFSAILVPTPRPVAAPFPGGHARQSSPLRVLLVEDEVIHQEITLKQLGGRCPVEVAATAGEALRLVAEKSYDLVLLDVMLSGQEARSLAGELRSASRTALRIILVSNMPMSAEEVGQLSADGALEKPFRFAGLEALLGAELFATA